MSNHNLTWLNHPYCFESQNFTSWLKTLPWFRKKSLILYQGNDFYPTAYWNVICKTGLVSFIGKYFKTLSQKVIFSHEQMKYFDNINSVQVFHCQFLQKLPRLFPVPLWNKKQVYISVQLQGGHFDPSEGKLRKHGDLFREQEKRMFWGIGNLKAPTVLPPFKGVLNMRWLSLFW